MDVPVWDGCRKLEENGAAVVGLNCVRGPRTTMTLMKEIRRACKGPIAAVPVPYRTSAEFPTFMAFKDPETGKQAFPDNLSAHLCNRTQIEEFAQAAKDLGVQYVGVCCGNSACFTRIVAETYGRRPPASKYSPNMSEHFIYGNENTLNKYYLTDLRQALSGNI